MTHLGLLDIIQLLGYMCMGIQMVLNSNFGLIPDKILGAFLYATWLGVIEMMLLLAVNRFIALTNVHISKKNSGRLFIALFIIAYGFMLVNLVILLLPEYGFLLNMTTYDLERLALETHLIDMQTNILFGILAISWALYLITIVHMIIKLVKDYEIRIFFQSLFICGYKSFVNGFTTYWVPPSVLAYYISFFVYLIESGYNPYMYFFTN
uniref:Uncharacterized protein n=1 Tax=Acrobeloides nanus TaxID=290746 RepID=A0A914D130_9BILA